MHLYSFTASLTTSVDPRFAGVSFAASALPVDLHWVDEPVDIEWFCNFLDTRLAEGDEEGGGA